MGGLLNGAKCPPFGQAISLLPDSGILNYNVDMINEHDRVNHKAIAVFTRKRGSRSPKGSFVQRVLNWSGEYEGESKLVICELIVAYCNGTDIADSSFSVVKKRNIVGVPGLSGIVQILMTELFPFSEDETRPRRGIGAVSPKVLCGGQMALLAQEPAARSIPE